MIPERASRLIVAFGDSITASGWPEMLAARLRSAGPKHMSVVNRGIAGNRILHDGAGQYRPLFGPAGITRFPVDALGLSGVAYVLFLEGVNDLAHPGFVAPVEEEVSAQKIIAGMQRCVDQAHARGVTMIGGTILPFEGNPAWTHEREAKRQAVNGWIRGAGAFDAVFDADAATRDPDRPTWLRPAYDSGDNLHPSRKGLQAVAGSVNLAVFAPT